MRREERHGEGSRQNAEVLAAPACFSSEAWSFPSAEAAEACGCHFCSGSRGHPGAPSRVRACLPPATAGSQLACLTVCLSVCGLSPPRPLCPAPHRSPSIPTPNPGPPARPPEQGPHLSFREPPEPSPSPLHPVVWRASATHAAALCVRWGRFVPASRSERDPSGRPGPVPLGRLQAGDSLVLGPLRRGASLPLPLLDFSFLPSETLLPSLGASHHTLQGLSVNRPRMLGARARSGPSS